ncbi:Chromate resistance protein ChrB [Pseudonocardia sp. N23]|uniref:Chromate resistance protein ChrB n=1 Tax=Pseudonocardia sp. N23 TaxID=1987376 RepID=UPI0035B5E294
MRSTSKTPSRPCPKAPPPSAPLRLLRRDSRDVRDCLAADLGHRRWGRAFLAARDDEYEDSLDNCHGFIAELRKEYKADHFTYAELEENDEDLIKRPTGSPRSRTVMSSGRRVARRAPNAGGVRTGAGGVRGVGVRGRVRRRLNNVCPGCGEHTRDTVQPRRRISAR